MLILKFLNKIKLILIFWLCYYLQNNCPDFLLKYLIKIIQHNTLSIKLFQFILLKLPKNKLYKYLMKLQDNCKEHSIDYTIELFNKNNQPISDLFEEFDYKPIASASIAQVYRAKLKNNKEVAVKVKHPNIAKLIIEESKGVTKFINKLNNILSYTTKNKKIPLDFDKFKESILSETNFINEYNNLKQIYNNKNKNIIIPEPIIGTEDYIIMSYETGQRLEEYELYNNKDIMKNRILEFMTFLIQIMIKNNLIHADIHTGNFRIKEDKIILYDFGNIVNIADSLYKTYMIKLCLSGNYIEFVDLVLYESNYRILNKEILEDLTKKILKIQMNSYKNNMIQNLLDVIFNFNIIIRTDILQSFKAMSMINNYMHKYELINKNIKNKKEQIKDELDKYIEYNIKNNNEYMLDFFRQAKQNIIDFKNNFDKFNKIYDKFNKYNKIEIDAIELYHHINSYIGILSRFGTESNILNNKIEKIYELFNNEILIKRYSNILTNKLANKSIYEYKMEFHNNLLDNKYNDSYNYIDKLIDNMENYLKINSIN